MRGRRLTPLNAIRVYCSKHCCAGDRKSWKECNSEICPLWYHRLGKRSLKKKSAGICLNSSKSAISQRGTTNDNRVEREVRYKENERNGTSTE